MKNVKLLYHGSDVLFDQFNLDYAKSFKDFGKGFYLTTSPKQAQKWAQQKANGKHHGCAYIYSFRINKNNINMLRLLELLEYNEEWLQFVVKCRFEGYEADYDIVYDKIADNRYMELTDMLQKYKQGNISAEYAISKIKMKRFEYDQYCFKNEKAIALLSESKVVRQYKTNTGVWKQEEVRWENAK